MVHLESGFAKSYPEVHGTWQLFVTGVIRLYAYKSSFTAMDLHVVFGTSGNNESCCYRREETHPSIFLKTRVPCPPPEEKPSPLNGTPRRILSFEKYSKFVTRTSLNNVHPSTLIYSASQMSRILRFWG